MKIILTQDEIHAAVEAYVRGQINIAENQEVAIDFTAGRGENGLTATLDIRTATVTPAAPVQPPSSPLKRSFATKEEAPAAPVKEPLKATLVEEPLTNEPEKDGASGEDAVETAEEPASTKSPFSRMKESTSAEPSEAVNNRPKSIFSRGN